MKKFSISILLFIMFVISSCYNNVCYWEFEQNFTSITAIQIIDTEDGYVYNVVKELDLEFTEELCRDIQKLEMKKYGTNLKAPSGYCFRIVFENGDYDVISKNESKHFRYDQASNQMIGHNSWLRCSDPVSFDNLIDKYMNS